MASHLGMAIQGILYSPFYRIKPWHLILAGIWTIHNDIIDYVFKMMPSYRDLFEYMDISVILHFGQYIVHFGCLVFRIRKRRFTLSFIKTWSTHVFFSYRLVEI